MEPRDHNTPEAWTEQIIDTTDLTIKSPVD